MQKQRERFLKEAKEVKHKVAAKKSPGGLILTSVVSSIFTNNFPIKLNPRIRLLISFKFYRWIDKNTWKQKYLDEKQMS